MILKKTKIHRTILVSAVLLLAPSFLTACSQYEADIPEYTTEGNRDTGFRAKTFEEVHGTEAPEKKEFNEKVDNGISSINDTADGYKNEIENFEEELKDAMP